MRGAMAAVQILSRFQEANVTRAAYGVLHVVQDLTSCCLQQVWLLVVTEISVS